jgi:hypothetical protein
MAAGRGRSRNRRRTRARSDTAGRRTHLTDSHRIGTRDAMVAALARYPIALMDKGLTAGGEGDRPSRRRRNAAHPNPKRRWLRLLATKETASLNRVRLRPVQASSTSGSSPTARRRNWTRSATRQSRHRFPADRSTRASCSGRAKPRFRPKRRKPSATFFDRTRYRIPTT